MPQKITELAQELGVTTESLKNFIEDFDLDLSECLFPNLEVRMILPNSLEKTLSFCRNTKKT